MTDANEAISSKLLSHSNWAGFAKSTYLLSHLETTETAVHKLAGLQIPFHQNPCNDYKVIGNQISDVPVGAPGHGGEFEKIITLSEMAITDGRVVSVHMPEGRGIFTTLFQYSINVGFKCHLLKEDQCLLMDSNCRLLATDQFDLSRDGMKVAPKPQWTTLHDRNVIKLMAMTSRSATECNDALHSAHHDFRNAIELLIDWVN